MPKGDKKDKKRPRRRNIKQKTEKKEDESDKSYLYRWFKPSRRLGSGGVLRKSAKLGRLIKWPKYVRIQRQRKILMQRIVIPPALNMFRNTASKDLARQCVKLLSKYKPEIKKEKLKRLRKEAKKQANNEEIDVKKPILIQYGFNNVTKLIESKQTKLVLIAHDVDPIELVLWMPALCVKKNVPYIIFRSKARLGKLVNKKTAACVALTQVRQEDNKTLKQLQGQAKKLFNSQFNVMKRRWSKRVLGIKTRHKKEKAKKARREEAERRREAQKQEQQNK